MVDLRATVDEKEDQLQRALADAKKAQETVERLAVAEEEAALASAALEVSQQEAAALTVALQEAENKNAKRQERHQPWPQPQTLRNSATESEDLQSEPTLTLTVSLIGT